MKFPANILHLFTPKANNDAPAIFNDYLLNRDIQHYSYLKVDEYRQRLLNDKTIINMQDFGSGSKKLHNNRRKICDIAKTSSTKPDYGGLFQKIINYYNLDSILELGTSLGIGSMYFASSTENAKLTSIEACPETFAFTSKKLKEFNITNTKLINKTFDSIFDKNLLLDEKYNLIYIDGNHNSESVLKYYNYISKSLIPAKCIIIIDDINWSRDMHKAWRIISKENSNYFRVNLYRMGIIFIGYDYPKGEFPLNFVNGDDL